MEMKTRGLFFVAETEDHAIHAQKHLLISVVLGTLLAALVPIVGFNAVMTTECFASFVAASLFEYSRLETMSVFTALVFSAFAWPTYLFTKEVKGTCDGLTAAALLAMVITYQFHTKNGVYDFWN